MRKLYIIFTFLSLVIDISVNAQLINMNPDPNGPVWISGDLLNTPQSSEWDFVELYPTAASQSLPLPSSVNNEDKAWFPYIYNQYSSGCCAHVAEVFNVFTYEVNRKFNDTAGTELTKTNIFHPLYSYNYLNNGFYNTPTAPRSGFQIVRDNGCPDWLTYDDPALNSSSTKYIYWMTGYEKYKAGMSNTISSTLYQFSFTLDYTFLYNIKHWISDHSNASTSGGLAIVGVFTIPWVIEEIQAGSYSSEHYIKQLGANGINSGHEMTICGYDDDVLVDINGDGNYTTDVNVNWDNYIDIRDCERGAFKVANSWGTDFGDQGFIWMPYYLFYPGNSGFNGCQAESCDVFGETGEMPQPDINLKINLEHDKRDHIKCSTAYAPAANYTSPMSWDDLHHLTYQGGFNPMRGCYAGPIDIGIAFSNMYNPNDVGKVFFKVKENNSSGTSYHGTINSFTLVDDRWGEIFELPFPQTNIPIPYNGETTLAVEYHLLPHETPIATATNINSNRVSRFTTTVTGGATLTVTDEAVIDMYNSEIHIEAGSMLALGHGTIKAKQGNCKIVVDGNISTTQLTTFMAEEGANLELILNNQEMSYLLRGRFQNCQLSGYAANLTLKGCQFIDCPSPHSYRGNVTVNDICTFENTGLWLENDNTLANAEVRIEYNYFTCNNPQPNELTSCIFIDSYGKYTINNNSIDGYTVDGLQISSSGNTVNSVNKISTNVISNCGGAGIYAYNSKGIIENNTVSGNKYGICLMDNSHFALNGNANATTDSETQQILNNTFFEVYASNFSFPYTFGYNVIKDPDHQGNPIDPLVFYNTNPIVYNGDQPTLPPGPSLNVKNNCWNPDFNPALDLKTTSGYYVYNPLWLPGGKELSIASDEELYNNALTEVENGNFYQAKELFRLLILTYPGSMYAQSSMKDLFYIEQQLSSDYAGLKAYYTTNDSIAADTLLSKLGDILSNQCEIKLQNWPDAISWYENRILNSGCMEDSIFAIIDLEYLYFLIENTGLKSGYSGKLNQFIPESKEKYNVDRAYLLSLLPEENKGGANYHKPADFSHGYLLQNNPNPFNLTTQIWYKIEKQSFVSISITDLNGKEVSLIKEGRKGIGEFRVDFTHANLAAGTYFYTLFLDGRKSDTKKMTITR